MLLLNSRTPVWETLTQCDI